MITFIDKPEGEMILFNTPTEVKTFFNSLNLEPEELEMFGIEIRSTEDEWSLSEVEKAWVAPVFNPNPYFDEKGQMMNTTTHAVTYRHKDMTLDQGIYHSFPMVAYIWLEDAWDRIGDQKIRIFNIRPLSKITTIKDIQDKVDENKEAWISNFEDAVAMENTLNETKKFTVYVDIDFDEDFRLHNGDAHLCKHYIITSPEDRLDNLLVNRLKDDLYDNIAYVNPSKDIGYILEAVEGALDMGNLVKDKAVRGGGNYEVGIRIESVEYV